MADLKGKRVSTGSPGSATEVMAFRVIEAAGLDKDKDMKRERLGVAESVNALKDRKIDAFFWVGGLPTAAVTDLGATPGVKIKLIDHSDVVDKMNAKYGNLYVTDVIPAKTYPGQDTENKIATVWNILVSDDKMSDAVAYAIVQDNAGGDVTNVACPSIIWSNVKSLNCTATGNDLQTTCALTPDFHQQASSSCLLSTLSPPISREAPRSPPESRPACSSPWSTADHRTGC
jgi:hypothetical protein